MTDLEFPETALGFLKNCNAKYMNIPSEFVDDYEWGFRNGIETAIAILEKRKAFYVNKQKKYDKYDMANYPEYFL